MERGDYNSGSDYVLEFGEMRFRFSHGDFAGRAEAAARELGLLPDRPLFGLERDDLAALVVDGEPVADPHTKLGEHLRDLWPELVELPDGSKGAAHWLRRLMFRQAWIDQRILEGEIEPVFTRRRGFVYVDPNRCVEHREIKLSPAPSFAAHRYG